MSEINNLRRQLNILLDATNKRPELVKRLQREILALMNAKAESKEDLELAEAKKRAEAVADEDFARWERLMARFFEGNLEQNIFEEVCLTLQQSHNTERGLRHEKV